MPLTVNKSTPSSCSKEEEAPASLSSDSTQTLRNSLTRFFSGTFLSRMSGLGRDASMAAAFGSDPMIAAFMVAFRFAHILRRLLGEGALHAAFVPQFEAIRHQNTQQGARFFRDLTVALTLFLCSLLALSTLALSMSLPYWKPDNREIVDLLLLMLPSALFICLFGLNSALLQCEKRYFLPAVAPVAFNLVWIAGVYSLYQWPMAEAIHGLSWMIVGACFVQWLVTLPAVLSVIKPILSSPMRLFSPELKQLAGALGLGIIGVGAVQFNSALDTLFARSADLSGPAYLWWAIRIQQAPIGLFGVAMAGALLPPLSRARKKGDDALFATLLSYALKKAVVFAVPFTVALWIGGVASVNLLYGRGHFGLPSVIHTTWCLWGYSLGMLPTIFVMILAPAFYAKGNYRVPTMAACLSVGVNVALNTFLIYGCKLGAASVAIATSVSAVVNAVYLIKQFESDVVGALWKGVGETFRALLFLSLLATGAAALVGLLFSDPSLSLLFGKTDFFLADTFVNQLLHYASMAAAYGAILALGLIRMRRLGMV